MQFKINEHEYIKGDKIHLNCTGNTKWLFLVLGQTGSTPPPGGYSFISPIAGRAAGQDMGFHLSVLGMVHDCRREIWRRSETFAGL